MNKIVISKPCHRCKTSVVLHLLPSDVMVDPCSPPQFLPFTTVRCPNCGKKVLFWTGFKQVVNNR